MALLVHTRGVILIALATLLFCTRASVAEHIILKNGFEVDCSRREAIGDRVRLYLSVAATDSAGFLEVAADSIQRVEATRDQTTPVNSGILPAPSPDIPSLLNKAGERNRIDADLLASVVQAESGGHTRAVSRAGARGLMQLMPATAHHLGLTDAFQPDQNIAGGAAYLDQLLTRYHDDITLALAAYNAGPAAVDRYRGIPPYRETQSYVARVIREFNRRKRASPAYLRASLSHE